MKQIKFFSLSILLAFLATSLFANNTYPAPTDIVKQYFTNIDAGNITEVEKMLSDDFMATAPFSPQPLNKQAWVGVGQGFKAAFPDMKHEMLSTIESGYSVAVRGIFKGQNTGSMMGNPATGNNVSLPFNTIFEFDKAWKIKALYVQYDQKMMEAQLMAGLPDQVAAAEATVRGLMTAADAGDLGKFMGYWAADGVNYFAGKQTSGDDMKKRIAAFKAAFPDIKRGIDEVIVSGNSVTVRGWVTGTNTGQFRGQAPTGNPIKVAWLGLYQLNAAGKIQRAWVEFDTAELDSQLKAGSAGKGK